MEGFEYVAGAILIVPVIMLVMANHWYLYLKEQRWLEVYGSLAEAYGWRRIGEENSWHDGYEIDVEGAVVGFQWSEANSIYYMKSFHDIEVGEGLAIGPEMDLGFLSSFIGPDEQLGDEAFDEAVNIEGDEVELTALMTSRVREALVIATEKGISLDSKRLERIAEGPFKTASEVYDFVQPLCTVAAALSCVTGTLVERLDDNFATERLSPVRARNLGMMLLHFEDDEHTQRRLLETLERAHLPAPGAATLEHQALLIEALKDVEEVKVAALVLLKRIGDFEALGPLRVYAAQPKTDYRFRLAQQAADAIQGRIGPILGGGLSMTEVPVGALSHVAIEGGQVSVAEQAKVSPVPSTSTPELKG